MEGSGAGAATQTGSLGGVGSRLAYLEGRNKHVKMKGIHQLKVRMKGILDRKEQRQTWGARGLLFNSERRLQRPQ